MVIAAYCLVTQISHRKHSFLRYPPGTRFQLLLINANALQMPSAYSPGLHRSIAGNQGPELCWTRSGASHSSE